VTDLPPDERELATEVPDDVEALLDELFDVIDRAKSMPLSSSAIVSRDEVLELADRARRALPGELLAARRMLRELDDLRRRAQQEADELLDEARAQAANLVQRTEVVRQARHQAERIILDAEAEARRVRHDADDYVDRKLAAFEIVLDRTIRTVQAGRERLGVAAPIAGADQEPESQPGEEGEVSPFDQDLL
jgi:cell division septum initiation protein DivIVA